MLYNFLLNILWQQGSLKFHTKIQLFNANRMLLRKAKCYKHPFKKPHINVTPWLYNIGNWIKTCDLMFIVK